MKVIIIKKQQLITHKRDTLTLKARRNRLRRQFYRQYFNDIIEKQKVTGEYQYRLLNRLAKQDKILRKIKEKSDLFYVSKSWKSKRERVLIRDNYTCKECGSKNNLHVHHIKYKMFSNKDEDLVTLCKYCHASKHPNNGIKMLNSKH